jgi:predicted amidohydrolase YtcJ
MIDPLERPVLTHCQVLGPDLIQRMKTLGVIANIQPSFVPVCLIVLHTPHLTLENSWHHLLYAMTITRLDVSASLSFPFARLDVCFCD